MRSGVAALLFALLAQDAFAQQQCFDALQRLDALQLVRGSGKVVFRCDPSGAWSLSVESQAAAQPHPGVAELQAYKRALCVAGSGAQTDLDDDAAREQLRQFVAGDAWKNVQDAAPEFDASLKRKLDKAVQLFPECNVQTGQIRNAYELVDYSRAVDSAPAGIANVERTLRQAAENLRLPSAGAGRPAIESLRAALETGGLLGRVDVKRDQLDDKLWPLVVEKSVAPSPSLPGRVSTPPSSSSEIRPGR